MVAYYPEDLSNIWAKIDELEESLAQTDDKVLELEAAVRELKHAVEELKRRIEPIEEYSLKWLERRVSGDDSTRRFLKEKAKQKVEEKARKRIDWQAFFKKLRKSKKGEWAPVEDLKDTGIVEELRRRNGCITTKKLKIYLLQGSKGEYVRVLRREQ